MFSYILISNIISNKNNTYEIANTDVTGQRGVQELVILILNQVNKKRSHKTHEILLTELIKTTHCVTKTFIVANYLTW